MAANLANPGAMVCVLSLELMADTGVIALGVIAFCVRLDARPVSVNPVRRDQAGVMPRRPVA